MIEPHTELVLEAPGGLVQVRATCHKGKVEQVRVRNLSSFVDRLDAPLEIMKLGTLTVDTAFGGDSFVIVDAQSLGFRIVPDEARELAQLGARITHDANEQLGFLHPDQEDWNQISFCMFTLPVSESSEGWIGRNTVSIRPGKLDRSPCGTGCSARMAVLEARGNLKAGQIFIGESVIGSRFYCLIEETITLKNGRKAIVPSISGRAWITGTHQYTLDPQDPWPEGYRISDTWPVLDGEKPTACNP